MSKKPRIAICYDFDGTLSPGNMQEYGFFTALGEASKNFWEESKKLCDEKHLDPILAYMKTMLDKAEIYEVGTRRQDFLNYGKSVEFFPGVLNWFKFINSFGSQQGLAIEHYIVSSGLKEIIEGTPIAKYFHKIYACSFWYDQNEVAKWPAVAVNYTTKTQFLFRINKGIEDEADHITINKYVPDQERPIPFDQMIYIGDGETDVPCMKLVKEKGGISIGLYPPKSRKKRKTAEQLLHDGRVNFISQASYESGERLAEIVKRVLVCIASRLSLKQMKTKLQDN